jgi:hypothetical protein
LNIVKFFTELNAEARSFLNIYSEISDRYRVSYFGRGISEFIGTIEGQNMINGLSKKLENMNISIAEIINILSKIEINLNDEIKEINDILIDSAITIYGIKWKNMWYKNNQIIKINEKTELDKYYENFKSPIKSLNKILSERKEVIGIITITEAMDVVRNIMDNNPLIIQ